MTMKSEHMLMKDPYNRRLQGRLIWVGNVAGWVEEALGSTQVKPELNLGF
jgi:hypothetical protein